MHRSLQKWTRITIMAYITGVILILKFALSLMYLRRTLLYILFYVHWPYFTFCSFFFGRAKAFLRVAHIQSINYHGVENLYEMAFT